MLDVADASNAICSSALEAKGETYTAYTAQGCPTAGAGTATGVASSTATPTGGSGTTNGGGATAGAASSSAAAASSSSSGMAAPMQTHMAMGIEGAALGVAALLLAAL
jgi:hypothetical protein